MPRVEIPAGGQQTETSVDGLLFREKDSAESMEWVPPFEDSYSIDEENIEADAIASPNTSLEADEQVPEREQSPLPKPIDSLTVELDSLLETVAYSDDEIDSILRSEPTATVRSKESAGTSSVHGIRQANQPAEAALSTQQEPVVAIAVSECKEAMQASLYVEDNETHSALKELLQQSAGRERVEMPTSLQEAAADNLIEAKVKHQNELSEQIVPHAQTFLGKAYRAGITETDQGSVSFKGQNYSVSYSKRSKALGVHAKKSGGYLRSVEGGTEAAQGLTEKDCAQFAAVAQKSQKQLKQMVKGKGSTVEIG